jgi:AcrR family transcriptional regulator
VAERRNRKAAPHRPRRMSAEARKDLVLRRAAELFSRRGFSGTTTAALARAARTSEAMLYKLFGSKRGLYAALIQRQVGMEGDSIFPVEAAARKDDREVLSTMARGYLEACGEDPTFMRLLHFSALEGNELADLFYEARVRRVIGFLSDYIRDRTREGAFRRVDPDLTALAFLGMVSQYVMARQVFGIAEARKASMVAAADAFVDLFLRGVRA